MGASGGWSSSEVVEAWAKTVEVRSRALATATDRMVTEAGVAAGSRVLDVGAGTGEMTQMLAERVGPSGMVVAVDGSPAMIEAAMTGFKSARLANVTAALMPAEKLAFEDSSFDAVVARNVLMFVDIPTTLREMRRVLRPGGRLAAIVWSELANNPFHAAILGAAHARGGWSEPLPDMAKAFALGDPDMYLGQLADAGFTRVAAHRVGSSRAYPSARAAVDSMKESPVQADVIDRLPEALRAGAWAEVLAKIEAYERDGTCEIPLESLVLVGQK
jgi:ubiquinone/menaquinone biosynthesis C-methylase UbiE